MFNQQIVLLSLSKIYGKKIQATIRMAADVSSHALSILLLGFATAQTSLRLKINLIKLTRQPAFFHAIPKTPAGRAFGFVAPKKPAQVFFKA